MHILKTWIYVSIASEREGGVNYYCSLIHNTLSYAIQNKNEFFKQFLLIIFTKIRAIWGVESDYSWILQTTYFQKKFLMLKQFESFSVILLAKMKMAGKVNSDTLGP